MPEQQEKTLAIPKHSHIKITTAFLIVSLGKRVKEIRTVEWIIEMLRMNEIAGAQFEKKNAFSAAKEISVIENISQIINV